MSNGFLKSVIRPLEVITAMTVAALMVTTVVDTTGRFLFSSPLPAANDYSRFWWMIIIVFMALAVAEFRKQHIEALVIEAQMPRSIRLWWRYIRGGIVLSTLVMFLLAAVPFAERHRTQGSYAPGSELVVWPTRYILVAGLLAFVVATIVRLVKDHQEFISGLDEMEGEYSEPI